MAGRCSKDEAPAADAIVVLGCRSRTVLQRRLDLALRLFRESTAPLMVLSGGGRGPVPEAEVMRRAALAQGIPEGALLIESVSRNTFENAHETARLLHPLGLRSVLLVSDRTHMPRAALLFRLAGLHVAGPAGATTPWSGAKAAAIVRELVALPWNLLRILLLARRR